MTYWKYLCDNCENSNKLKYNVIIHVQICCTVEEGEPISISSVLQKGIYGLSIGTLQK